MNTQNAKAGILGGLAGGLIFGMLMAMMGMLPMIASLVGSKSAAVGFLVHLVISAGIGLGFGLLLGDRVTGTGAGMWQGAVYGMVWWVLGPLVIMPLMMGMGVQFAQAFTTQNLMSLMGHVIYGAVLGGVFALLRTRNVAAPQPVR